MLLCWRALNEIAAGGRALSRISAAVNSARPAGVGADRSPAQGAANVRVADKLLQGVTCLRLDAPVIAHH